MHQRGRNSRHYRLLNPYSSRVTISSLHGVEFSGNFILTSRPGVMEAKKTSIRENAFDLLQCVNQVIRAVVFFLVMLLFIPGALVILLLGRLTPWKRTINVFGMTVFNQLLITIFDIDVYIQGKESFLALSSFVSDGAVSILLFSHASNFDAPILSAVMGHLDPSFLYAGVGKRDIFRTPLIGWFFSLTGMIPIDRSSLADAIHSLNDAGELLKSGVAIAISPEGTRRRTPSVGSDHLLPFKKGPFHMLASVAASGKRVAAMPVVFAGSRAAWPGMLPIPGSRVCIRFGTPATFTGTVEVSEASSKCREIFVKEVDSLCKDGQYSGSRACELGERLKLNLAVLLATQLVCWAITCGLVCCLI